MDDGNLNLLGIMGPDDYASEFTQSSQIKRYDYNFPNQAKIRQRELAFQDRM